MSSRKIKTEKIASANGIKNVVKGCNCKRTKCLKNFCECYKNSKLCTEFCKCIDCHNVLRNNISVSSELSSKATFENQPHTERHVDDSCMIVDEEQQISYTISTSKKPINILTSDIIESTIECVIGQAEECQKNNVSAVISEKMVLEEFGRCLDEIIRLTN